jgi:hypothetical protein
MDVVLESDLARLHHDHQVRARWFPFNPAATKQVEAHYRARLVRLLTARGIAPLAVRPANDPVDLDIAGYPVELKVARAHPHKSGGKLQRYQALLRDPENRHYLNGTYLILLCVDPDDRLWPFVIPTRQLASQRTITISSHPSSYAGRWAPFLNAFDYFEGEDPCPSFTS